MHIQKFEDSDAWKEARKLMREVYSLTGRVLFKNDFGMKDQIQRAAVSCMSNIAEGFDSDTDQQFIQFLVYAKRSASEVQSVLYAALDLAYINEKDFSKVYETGTAVRKLCAGFIKYLKKTGDR